MKATLALSALLASTPSCFALTFAGATENLLYFEYATLANDHCEKRNIPTRQTLTAWQAQHEPLFRQTIDTVRAEGKRRGLATAHEQDALLFEIMNMARTNVQGSMARKGVPCTKFSTYIDSLANFFKR